MVNPWNPGSQNPPSNPPSVPPPAPPSLDPPPSGTVARPPGSSGRLPPPITARLGTNPPVYYQAAPKDHAGGLDWSQSRWGIPDIVLGIIVVLVALFIALIVGLASEAAFSTNGFDIETAESGIFMLVSSLVGLQGSMALWPVVVASWKGKGVINDFGLRFRWRDLAIGPAVAIAMLILSTIVGFVVSALVGLDDPSEASNTDLLTDVSGGLARSVLIASIVIGAPLSEELFFRGLSLRAIQKRAGKPLALVLSTVLFAGPHFQGGSWQSVVVLLSSIGVIGLVLGSLALLTDRLGPSIIAHSCFNGIVVLVALNLDAIEGLEGAIGLNHLGLWF